MALERYIRKKDVVTIRLCARYVSGNEVGMLRLWERGCHVIYLGKEFESLRLWEHYVSGNVMSLGKRLECYVFKNEVGRLHLSERVRSITSVRKCLVRYIWERTSNVMYVVKGCIVTYVGKGVANLRLWERYVCENEV